MLEQRLRKIRRINYFAIGYSVKHEFVLPEPKHLPIPEYFTKDQKEVLIELDRVYLEYLRYKAYECPKMAEVMLRRVDRLVGKIKEFY